jgi:phosphatidylinositol alpha-1,6-mannosyltransferase
MESLSYGLTTGYPEPKTIIALRRSQKHLVWFLPYVIVRLALTAHRYDVIHLGDALLCSAGFVPRLVYRRPVAVSVHGLDLTFRNWLYQAYLALFLRADVFIANSESTRRIADARGLSPVRTITIGVPDHYFTIKRTPRLDAEFEARRAGRALLLTVGRLVRRKGAAWFAGNVLPNLPGALYVAVGEGPDRAEILRVAKDAGTLDRVWLPGKVSEQRLFELLGASDVFVMPNVEVQGDVEGFGIVAIEAAAAGVPVVAARLEGIPDAITHGQNGHLVEPADAGAFITVLTRLLADPAERTRLGERGREYTREHNAWPRIVSEYVTAFGELALPARRQEPS